MNKIAAEAKIIAYKAELEGSVTNRRREIIAKELHKLSASISEDEKIKEQNLIKKHTTELADVKNDYDDQIEKLIIQLNSAKKETQILTEEKRINKAKAQNIFKKLNAKLTPDEMRLFSDGLNFIRLFV